MAEPLDDAALVDAAQRGDRAALDQLLRRHFDRMHAVCLRITGRSDDAADAAQEAMIAVVRHLDRFDGRSSFGTWVYRIATNASLDELRRRRRRPVLAGPDRDADRDAHHGADDLIDRIPDTHSDERIGAIADRDELEAAFRALPEEFRVPVVFRDVGDLDYAEIAATLGIPIGTVKSRIARGRAALAATLGNRTGPTERPTTAP